MDLHLFIYFIYGFYTLYRYFSFYDGDRIQVQYLSHGMVLVKPLDEVVADDVI